MRGIHRLRPIIFGASSGNSSRARHAINRRTQTIFPHISNVSRMRWGKRIESSMSKCVFEYTLIPSILASNSLCQPRRRYWPKWSDQFYQNGKQYLSMSNWCVCVCAGGPLAHNMDKQKQNAKHLDVIVDCLVPATVLLTSTVYKTNYTHPSRSPAANQPTTPTDRSACLPVCLFVCGFVRKVWCCIEPQRECFAETNTHEPPRSHTQLRSMMSDVYFSFRSFNSFLTLRPLLASTSSSTRACDSSMSHPFTFANVCDVQHVSCLIELWFRKVLDLPCAQFACANTHSIRSTCPKM